MPTTTAHPVDSATRRCCGGIGAHTAGCATPDTDRDPHARLDAALQHVRHTLRNVALASAELDDDHRIHSAQLVVDLAGSARRIADLIDALDFNDAVARHPAGRADR